MSLTDRNRAPAPPAPPADWAPPTTPGGAQPKSNRVLWVVAIGFIVLAVVLGVIAYTLGRTSSAGTPGTGPASAAVPSTEPTPTPTPSPTPTLSERDQAAAAASNGFKSYVAADQRAGNAGGADKLPKDVAATVTGPQAKVTLDELKQIKAGGFAGSGSAVAYTRVDSLSELNIQTPTARIATCIDQSKRTVTKNGKPFAGKPQYIRGQYLMHRVGGAWKVYDGTSEIYKDGDCLAALGPTAR